MEQKLNKWFDLLTHKLAHGQVIEMPVLSGSMMKELVPGRSVKIKIIRTFGLFRVGDIAVFKQGRKLFSHRILLKINVPKHRIIYQKGDANQSGSWIDADNLLGKVIESVDYHGKHIYYEKFHRKLLAKIKALFNILNLVVFMFKSFIKNILKLIRRADEK